MGTCTRSVLEPVLVLPVGTFIPGCILHLSDFPFYQWDPGVPAVGSQPCFFSPL